MSKLLDYLNSLARPEQAAFAQRCDTTLGYLRKAASVGQKIAVSTCASIERESGGAVACEELRPQEPWRRIPDAQWPHPKGRPVLDYGAVLAPQAPAAIKTEAQEGAHA